MISVAPFIVTILPSRPLTTHVVPQVCWSYSSVYAMGARSEVLAVV